MVEYAFNPSSREAEAGQPGLQSEFQDSQGYTEKPCLEPLPPTQKKKKEKKSRSEQRTMLWNAAGVPL